MICLNQRIKFNFTHAAVLSETSREVWTITERVLGRHHYRNWRRCPSEPQCRALCALTEILLVFGAYMSIARAVRTGRIPLDDTPAPSPQKGALQIRTSLQRAVRGDCRRSEARSSLTVNPL